MPQCTGFGASLPQARQATRELSPKHLALTFNIQALGEAGRIRKLVIMGHKSTVWCRSSKSTSATKVAIVDLAGATTKALTLEVAFAASGASSTLERMLESGGKPPHGISRHVPLTAHSSETADEVPAKLHACTPVRSEQGNCRSTRVFLPGRRTTCRCQCHINIDGAPLPRTNS